MIKKIILWILAVIITAVLYIFENNAGTLTLLAGTIIIPLIGLITLACNKPEIEIQLDDTCEKGKNAFGSIAFKNNGLIPLSRLKTTVICSNLHTVKKTETDLEISLLPKQKKTIPFNFDCPHCGVNRIYVKEIKIGDVFGIFYKKLDSGTAKVITILPQLFKTDIYLENTDTAMPESDVYSSSKPGNDPGEIFAVREYVPSDAIRKIHWKLSEKTDTLMVKEFGLPIFNTTAMIFENLPPKSAEEMDTITEVFASVSSAMLESGISHSVFWKNYGSEELCEFHIDNEDDFAFMLEQLLSLTPEIQGSAVKLFAENHSESTYSHIIITGNSIPAEIEHLSSNARVSILMPQQNTVIEGLQPDGSYVMSFDTDNYDAQLCTLEV